MFRVSKFMNEILHPGALAGRRVDPPGPVVIWNLIRRCNLTCKHCYSISADTNFPGELTTEQVYTVMDDLKGFKVPVLILSGGEPLLRPDLFDIAALTDWLVRAGVQALVLGDSRFRLKLVAILDQGIDDECLPSFPYLAADQPVGAFPLHRPERKRADGLPARGHFIHYAQIQITIDG